MHSIRTKKQFQADIQSGLIQLTITDEIYDGWYTGRVATLRYPIEEPPVPYTLLGLIKGDPEELATSSYSYQLTLKVSDEWHYKDDDPSTHSFQKDLWSTSYLIRQDKSFRDPHLVWFGFDKLFEPEDLGLEPIIPDETIKTRVFSPDYIWLSPEEAMWRGGFKGGPCVDLSMLHYTTNSEPGDQWHAWPRWDIEKESDSKWFNPQGFTSLYWNDGHRGIL